MGFLFWADVSAVNPRDKQLEGLSIGNERGDKLVIAQSLCNIGLICVTEGRYRDAYFFFKQSLDLFQELRFRHKEYTWTLTFLGDVLFLLNDLEGSRSYYERSIHSLRQQEDRNFLAYAVRRLAQLNWYCGEYEQAAEFCRESLTINRELGDVRGILASLAAFAGIATAQSQLLRAAQIYGAVDALLAARNIRMMHMDRKERERNLSILQDRFDLPAFDQASGMGALMSMEEIVEFALQGIP
jgi:tetratricopeptide (TPR) repeat protein